MLLQKERELKENVRESRDKVWVLYKAWLTLSKFLWSH
jgi:hypothetical protein